MKPTAPPLRILAIVNLPWDSRLGASRVWIELTKEWVQAGHTVEKFCLTDAYPQPARSRAGSALRQVLFPRKAAAYVRENADRFDVIDCLVGVLPFSKRSLRFRGLLVSRSVGLYRLYNQFLQEARTRWPDQPKGRWFGRIFHHFIERWAWRDAEKSIRTCDLLNLPNEDERVALARDPTVPAPAIVQPYGLSDLFLAALAGAAAPAAERLARQKICFIGMWGPRKGSRDWPKIMATIGQRHPAAEFLFLGTMFDESVVRAELGPTEAQRLTCRPTFAGSELPALLADCTLALFPSYIEGFGLAVIEQLGAGLPTIAYDVSGPRQILHAQRADFLTPAGETGAMAARAAQILALGVPEYEKLSAACAAIAREFRWSDIARHTIEEYRVALDSLGKPSPAALRG